MYSSVLLNTILFIKVENNYYWYCFLKLTLDSPTGVKSRIKQGKKKDFTWKVRTSNNSKFHTVGVLKDFLL